MTERCWKCGSEEVPQEPIVLCGATFKGFQMCMPCELADARSRGIDPSLALAYLREVSERRQAERREEVSAPVTQKDKDAADRWWRSMYGVIGYVRLIESAAQFRADARAEAEADLYDLLVRVSEYLDDRSDTVDGEDGPRPNAAMSLGQEVDAALEKLRPVSK